MGDQVVAPFRINIPQHDLDDLRVRLERTRWGEEVPAGADYGVPVAWIDDSPVGLLAWQAQLLGEDLDEDFALTNVMMYWLTRTGSSAGRLYFDNSGRSFG